MFSDEDVSGKALSYGPDLGFEGLRDQVSKWLGGFYGTSGIGNGGGKKGVGVGMERICISGVSLAGFETVYAKVNGGLNLDSVLL